MKHRVLIFMLVTTVILVLMVACASNGNGSEPGGQEAFVDDVTVKEAAGHSYAAVAGHYPDTCSRVSQVQQSVNDSEISIVLYVDRPADLMCATMLTPFQVDILLETGGLAPGDYTVTVNESRSAVFTLSG